MPSYSINSWRDALRPILLSCVVCQQPLMQQERICPDCVDLLAKTSRLFDPTLQLFSRDWHRTRVLGAYDGLLAQLISQGKFSARPELLVHLSRLFANQLLTTSAVDDMPIVAVPMSRWQRIRRGYNQVDLITEQLSIHMGLPLLPNLVRHTGMSKTQHLLTKAARQKNRQKAFYCHSKAPHRLVLVDDVITTGATMAAICRHLKAAGATYIEVWALALTAK